MSSSFPFSSLAPSYHLCIRLFFFFLLSLSLCFPSIGQMSLCPAGSAVRKHPVQEMTAGLFGRDQIKRFSLLLKLRAQLLQMAGGPLSHPGCHIILHSQEKFSCQQKTSFSAALRMAMSVPHSTSLVQLNISNIIWRICHLVQTFTSPGFDSCHISLKEFPLTSAVLLNECFCKI